MFKKSEAELSAKYTREALGGEGLDRVIKGRGRCSYNPCAILSSISPPPLPKAPKVYTLRQHSPGDDLNADFFYIYCHYLFLFSEDEDEGGMTKSEGERHGKRGMVATEK